MPRPPLFPLLLLCGLAACATGPGTSTGQGAGSVAQPEASPEARRPDPATVPVPPDSIRARADRDRVQGRESARVFLVVASDFQCPFCRQWHEETYPAIVRDYVATGKIRLVYLNFPLAMHPNAVPSAEAAMCAGAQGRFWPMHDALFATQERWGEIPDPLPVLDSLATATRLDLPAWRSCMATHATRPLIDADRERSVRTGLRSTPGFFIDDQALLGAQPYAVFRQALDAALARRGGAGR